MMTSNYLGIPPKVEAIALICAGILGVLTDSSLQNFNKNMDSIWKLTLDPNKFSALLQITVKYTLSTVVYVKAFTLHMSLVFFVIALWPAIFEIRPNLLLPWLLLGIIRDLICDVLSVATGLYICLNYGIFSFLWVKFLIVEFLELGPHVYIWFSVRRFYSYLVHLNDQQSSGYRFRLEPKPQMINRKFLMDDSELLVENHNFLDDMFEDKRNYITESIMGPYLHSLDTKKKCFKSRSLDGLLDILAMQQQREVLLRDDESFQGDIREKVMKRLNITTADIEEAQVGKLEELLAEFSEETLLDKIQDILPRLSESRSVNTIINMKGLTVSMTSHKKINRNLTVEKELNVVNLCSDSKDFSCQVSTLSRKFLHKASRLMPKGPKAKLNELLFGKDK